MTQKSFKPVIFLILLFCTVQIVAQTMPEKNWDIEKIRGTRLLPYPSYIGFPFLTINWVPGKIVLANGTEIDSLSLKYSSYKDELAYFNHKIVSPIVIDKISLKGFSFTDQEGNTHIFQKQYFNNFDSGNRFFEILSDGPIDLLVYRKVTLGSSSVYKDKDGIVKNMEYSKDYAYYFYSAQIGYHPVRISLISFLNSFAKASQKPIKKLLRKNKIKITDEQSFVKAWEATINEGYKLAFSE